jgi:hypothetical protein
MTKSLDGNFESNPDWKDVITARLGGTWKGTDTGVTIPDCSLFWTDLLLEGATFPEGIVVIKNHGYYGVYFVPAGSDFILPESSSGGRWIAVAGNLTGSDELTPVDTTNTGALMAQNITFRETDSTTCEVGVPMADVQALKTPGMTFNLFLPIINTAFEADWWAMGDAWESPEEGEEQVIPSCSVVWTDLGATNAEVAASPLEPIVNKGGWGAFFVPAGIEMILGEGNEGGRWIPVATSRNQCITLFSQSFLGEDNTPQVAIDFMDANFGGTYPEGLSTVTVSEGDVALVWANFEQGVPVGFSPITTSSVSGGSGVWVVIGPAQFQYPESGGGLYVFTCVPTPPKN